MKVGSLAPSPAAASASAFSREKIEHVRVSRCDRRGARTREIDRHRASSSTNELESHTTLSRGVMSSSCVCNHRLGTRFSSPPSPSRARTRHRRPTPTRPLLAPAPRTRVVTALCRATKRSRHWKPGGGAPGIERRARRREWAVRPVCRRETRASNVHRLFPPARAPFDRTNAMDDGGACASANARSNPSTWRSRATTHVFSVG